MKIRGVIGGSAPAQSPALGVERTVNLIPIPNESGTGGELAYLLTVPGYREFAGTYGDSLSGPSRGMYAGNDRCFLVHDADLKEFGSDGWVYTRGTMTNHPRRVFMDSNGVAGGQLGIASAGLLYVYDLAANTLTQVTDPQLPADIAGFWFANSHGVAFSRGAVEFYGSDQWDFTAWAATDVMEKQNTSDYIQAGCAVGDVIWIFGRDTVEPWYYIGSPDLWIPIKGAVLRPGIHAPDSLAKLGDAPFWLGAGKDGGIGAYMGTGPTGLRKISTVEQDSLWRTLTRTEEAEGWTYGENGHGFYVLTIPDAPTSWVYDNKTDLWHERGVFINGAYQPDLGRCHAYAFGKHLVGSRVADVYEMTFTTHTYANIRGQEASPHPRRWLRRFATIQNGAEWIFFKQLTLKMQTGVGLTDASAQGGDPEIMVRFSDDGGRTWSNERWIPLGKIGAYETVIREQRWGRARSGRVWEISGSDPVIGALIDGWFDAAIVQAA